MARRQESDNDGRHTTAYSSMIKNASAGPRLRWLSRERTSDKTNTPSQHKPQPDHTCRNPPERGARQGALCLGRSQTHKKQRKRVAVSISYQWCQARRQTRSRAPPRASADSWPPLLGKGGPSPSQDSASPLLLHAAGGDKTVHGTAMRRRAGHNSPRQHEKNRDGT